jgi:hypothetical protein
MFLAARINGRTGCSVVSKHLWWLARKCAYRPYIWFGRHQALPLFVTAACVPLKCLGMTKGSWWFLLLRSGCLWASGRPGCAVQHAARRASILVPGAVGNPLYLLDLSIELRSMATSMQ